jgi:hypothetical protein
MKVALSGATPARAPLASPSGPLLLRCRGTTCPPGTCNYHDDRTLLRATRAHDAPEQVPPIVHEVLRTAGDSLDPATRADFERRFGHDFGSVRVHTDERASASAVAVHSLAYTVANDVVFARGNYQPGSDDGRRLLAHELAHVVQQDGTSGAPTRVAPSSDPLESDASAASGSHFVAGRTGPTVQRQPKPTTKQWGPQFITAGLGILGDACAVLGSSDGQMRDESGKPSAPYSIHCPGRVCVNAPVPLKLWFHVDADLAPRPQPFTPPRLSASVTFIASSGGTQTPIPRKVGTGAYKGPGAPLVPSFGDRIPLVPSTEGTLRISLIISDHDSGEVSVYSDDVPVVDCGRPRPPGPKIAVPSTRQSTGRHVFVPDPKGAPRQFREITGKITDPAWGQMDKVFEVLLDEKGPYFMVGGQRVDVPRSGG